MSGLRNYSFISLSRKDFEKDNQDLFEKIKQAETVLNLAGSPILKRWTRKTKKAICASRIEPTRKLADAIGMMDHDVHLLSASAIGIYDNMNIHHEDSREYSEGFIRELLDEWEKEAMKISNGRHQVTILRIGLVISGRGGILKYLWPVFKMGFGGTLGNGKQMMSFIHIDDLISAIDFIIRKEIYGIVNLTAPAPVTNREFTKIFSAILRKPAFLKIPGFILKLMFGKGADIILSGQHVHPGVLLGKGFIFKYPDIRSALKNAIESS